MQCSSPNIVKAAAFFALALLGLVLLRRRRPETREEFDQRWLGVWRDLERVDSV